MNVETCSSVNTEAVTGGSGVDARFIPAIAADGTLYPVEKLHAHRTRLLHLAISVFVFQGDALLIQRRALGKYHCGGLWANTCCSHPYWGETVEDAAHRRLREELGVDLSLSACRVGEYSADVGNGLWECERVHMFRADVGARTLMLSPNATEVAGTRWISHDGLRRDLARRPETYAPWFRIYLERYPDVFT